ncbi:MAG: GWxTD domain-containing protein [Bacteroidales bacterium]|nr:GWxTD domain-containing protein [Bacteroidales bacterium]
MKPGYFISLTLLVLILQGCVPVRYANRIDHAPLYQEDRLAWPQVTVFHAAVEKSVLYISIPLEGFMHDGDTSVMVRAGYRLHPFLGSPEVIDSASILIADTAQSAPQAEMVVSFEISHPDREDAGLTVFIRDLRLPASSTFYAFASLVKEDINNRQHFMICDENGLPVFYPWIGKDRKYMIRRSFHGEKQLFVGYYHKVFQIAKPPFVYEKDIVFRFAPDSLFSLTLGPDGYTPLFSLDKPGIYHFQADTSVREGITLFLSEDGFPEVNTPEQALKTLRYITSQKEFDRLMKYGDCKTAVDSFWLKRARQDPERARSMIKRYYGRVEQANLWFSSYKEGWKTDRGITYIIFGPPNHVYRDKGEEEWIYGDLQNPLSVSFSFRRSENPFTENDFRMSRSPAYRENWYLAVDNWRRK